MLPFADVHIDMENYGKTDPQKRLLKPLDLNTDQLMPCVLPPSMRKLAALM